MNIYGPTGPKRMNETLLFYTILLLGLGVMFIYLFNLFIYFIYFCNINFNRKTFKCFVHTNVYTRCISFKYKMYIETQLLNMYACPKQMLTTFAGNCIPLTKIDWLATTKCIFI